MEQVCVNGLQLLERNDETKLYVTKEKYFIYVYSPKHKRSIRYNLKDKQMERQHPKTGVWEYVEQQYRFFYGFQISDLIFEDKKFEEIIEVSKKFNNTCKTVSSFISRMDIALMYETYISEGIQYEPKKYYSNGSYNYSHFQHPLQDYDKNVIKFFKEIQFEITTDFERKYFEESEKYIKIISMIQNCDITNEEKLNLLSNISDKYYGEDFWELIDFGYESKALIHYIFNYLKPFENINSVRTACQLLRDYYRMAHQIGRNVKKYPKYLKSMHDIIQSNYNAFKKEYSEELFRKMIKPELELEDKDFIIKNPTCSKDIISEGTSLNHCVGSYVDKILKGTTYIFFLRKKKFPDMSLVTLEYNNGAIIQARGSYNRSLTEDEIEFLKKYCKKMKLELVI